MGAGRRVRGLAVLLAREASLGNKVGPPSVINHLICQLIHTILNKKAKPFYEHGIKITKLRQKKSVYNKAWYSNNLHVVNLEQY